MVPYSSGSSFRGNKWGKKQDQGAPKVTVFDPTGGLRESFSKPGSRGGETIEQVNFGGVSGGGGVGVVSTGGMRAQTSPGTTRNAKNQYSIASINKKAEGMFERQQSSSHNRN